MKERKGGCFFETPCAFSCCVYCRYYSDWWDWWRRRGASSDVPHRKQHSQSFDYLI